MNKKITAYLLIVFGLIPVSIFVILKIMSRTEQHFVIQDQRLYDLFVEYGQGTVMLGFFIGLVMITIGWMILKKEKALAMVSGEEHELNEGERIVYRKAGGVSIVTVTNQRIRYYCFLKNDRLMVPDMPAEREDFPIRDISSVKVVRNSDVVQSWIKVKTKWGIQLELKNGRIVNMPIEEQEVLVNHIENQVKLS